jgi:hypothetical protein
MTRSINGIDKMKTLVGEHLGWSPNTEITREQIQKFAELIGDHQWIRIDGERATAGRRATAGPFAHGYMTLSLGAAPSPQVLGASGVTLVSVDDAPGDAQVTQEFVFECEGAVKPSCVPEVIVRSYV